ncbi:RNA polymerase sigma-70 factor (ECF subfamily) [Nocardioides ginsengisegetis]|uniref:RNA polymerase sigma-70 factor (ECF subfamily) n=1 Tax=Nocardioides ginsengisegetis TaxID=661491 RepID=A0A7W3J3C3_9ACTN|nr:RNA polymerase sigma-70 factor (ECF subfamily) [Nocardioides ginsengisegetis]
MKGTITASEFEELYRVTARDVFAYVRRRRTGDAEEIVAETYAVAWRRRNEMPPQMFRRAWLFGVARRLLVAASRQQQRETALKRELTTLPIPEHDTATRAHTAQVMSAALRRLPREQQELLRLVAWEGLTPAELAVSLGVRPGTARVRLHRARRALASDIEVRSLVDGTAREPLSAQ